MKLSIQTSSMIPIYEQIYGQTAAQIREGRLKENEALPSVRALAREYRISALTVKKAYDLLEEQGLIVTIQGKGSFVAHIPENVIREEIAGQAENLLETAIDRTLALGLSKEEIKDLFLVMLEDHA